MNKILFRLITLAMGALFVVSAQADINTYHVHGIVQAIDAANHRVTLSQDAVSELGWPVRTMTYEVDGDGVLKGITTGQSVDVSFTVDTPYQAMIHFINPTSH